MEATHTMEYPSGGGNWYDGGTWNIKETEKTVTFTEVKEAFFDSNMPKKVRIPKSKNKTPHCLSNCNDNDDGQYVVYPYQGGTPNIFIKI